MKRKRYTEEQIAIAFDLPPVVEPTLQVTAAASLKLSAVASPDRSKQPAYLLEVKRIDRNSRRRDMSSN